jgi:di/tricarboxylate transporter
MTTDLAIVLGLLGVAIGMFAINKPRMDAVGLIMLTVLPFTGTISMADALAGFSDSSVVLLGALFVIGEGLVRTGVAQRLGDWLLRTAGKNETRLIALLMAMVATMGAFMSSTGVVAIFIPVALRIAQMTGTSPAQLMMPISAAALISGMMTLVATAPNLVVNSELLRQGNEGFAFFTFTPFGVPILLLGIGYMLFARRWLKTDAGTAPDTASGVPGLSDYIERYSLADRELRVRVKQESPLVGQTLDQLRIGSAAGIHVIAIERRNRNSTELFAPTGRTELRAGDVALVDVVAGGRSVQDACAESGLEELPLTGEYFSDTSQEIGMAEVMVTADSRLVGRTVAECQVRTSLGLTIVGLRHGQQLVREKFLSTPLGIGDTLLVIGPWRQINRLQADRSDLVLLSVPSERESVLPAPGKALQAVFCLVLMVILMVTGAVPNVQAAFIACLLMGALRCIDLESAYRSIHWKSLILIIGMLPFSIALQNTGGVELAADGLMAVTGGLGDRGILACLFAITAMLGLFISNTATAVLMAPVAIAIANELDASPYPFAMIVALAASTAFMTPISSPVNTLVVAPGNYGFGDFVKVGVPFSVVVLIVSVLLVPLLLPLRP